MKSLVTSAMSGMPLLVCARKYVTVLEHDKAHENCAMHSIQLP